MTAYLCLKSLVEGQESFEVFALVFFLEEEGEFSWVEVAEMVRAMEVWGVASIHLKGASLHPTLMKKKRKKKKKMMMMRLSGCYYPHHHHRHHHHRRRHLASHF